MPLFVGASESYDTDAWEAYNLKKENAKLREEIEAAKHDLSLFSGELVASKLENAKLRELCKAWREFSYDLFDEFIGEPEMSDDFMALEGRMHELRVDE